MPEDLLSFQRKKCELVGAWEKQRNSDYFKQCVWVPGDKVMALNKGYENWFSCKTGGLGGKGCLVLMRKHQKMVLILENWKNLVLLFRER